jgi:hypothetical protein
MILGDFQRFFRVPSFWWSLDIWVFLGCIKKNVIFEGKIVKSLGFSPVFKAPNILVPSLLDLVLFFLFFCMRQMAWSRNKKPFWGV